jgi:hypothetical protein
VLCAMKSCLSIALLTAALTGLNAVKPLHVDDATFYFNAAQTAYHPLDPYGFVMLRWSDAVPALHALAPPVLPYWWAAAIRMFGDRPVMWKLWLLPFALIFVSSLAALLRRFAPAVAAPLLVLMVLSPVFLPSLNLMMDIPALALSLLALVMFCRACDRNSPVLAVLAGLTAGLAMQTKYTALLAPAVLLVYSWLHSKWRLGIVAALVAGFVFSSWESLLYLRYGESHFIYQLFQGDNGEQPKVVLLGSLFPLLGGASPFIALLALTVLSAPRWLLVLAALALAFPFLLLLSPDNLSSDGRAYELATILFGCDGAVVLLSVGWAAFNLLATDRFPIHPRPDSDRTAWFLVLWLVLELAGYILISPFPAVRRIMGITIAMTLLIGLLASRASLGPRRSIAALGIVVVTALLGIGFFAVDYLEARAGQQAAYAAARLIHREHSQAKMWYAGYWGFQYYAEKCGMKQIVPLRNNDEQVASLLSPSRLKRGDWLVMPDKDIPQQELDLQRAELGPPVEIAVGDAVPLSTLMCYYAGSVPLRHRSGPRIVLRLYLVRDEFIAR